MKTIIILLALTGLVACSKSSDTVTPAPEYIEVGFEFHIGNDTPSFYAQHKIIGNAQTSTSFYIDSMLRDTMVTHKYINGDTLGWKFYPNTLKNGSSTLTFHIPGRKLYTVYASTSSQDTFILRK